MDGFRTFPGLVLGEAKPRRAGKEAGFYPGCEKHLGAWECVLAGTFELGDDCVMYKEQCTRSSRELKEQISINPPIFECISYHVY